jgi:hypothetical protein
MGCVMKVTKTDDGRTVCGVSGVLCQVSGALASLGPMEICSRHRCRLMALGLEVEKCIPLVAAATKAEAKRAAGICVYHKNYGGESVATCGGCQAAAGAA